SEGHSLYLQRKTHRIVHLLRMRAVEGGLRVEEVTGFNENRDVQSWSFGCVPAQLEPASFERIRARLLGAEDGEHATILGRMDMDEFERSLGARVVFEHVRMSFEPGEVAPLVSHERIFVQCGSITPMRNDIKVQLQPVGDLDEEDVGSDMRSLILLRRGFSARQDLLGRVYRTKGPAALAGTYLLLRFEKKGDRIQPGYLQRFAPRRRASALASALASRRSRLFACLVALRDEDLELELRPGIVVRLPKDRIEDVPAGLLERSIVVVEQGAGSSFRVQRASFGYGRYIDEQVRPVVLLPKNELLRYGADDPEVRNVGFWQNRSLFTVGGFPEIEAALARWDAPRWLQPAASDGVRLMRDPHPKIGLVGMHPKGPRVALAAGQAWVGRLEVEKDTLGLRIRRGARDDEGDARELDWRDATFADEDARAAKLRIEERSWEYHDTDTGHWLEDGTVGRVRTGVHDGYSGPLFFARHGERPTLRYSAADASKFVQPADELIEFLALAGAPRRVHVAGRSAGDGAMHVEISPGRVVEVPARRFVGR
ncbi:MAG: hypothetical protein AAFZ65_20630, partial [Planctomycetota bacterium]